MKSIKLTPFKLTPFEEKIIKRLKKIGEQIKKYGRTPSIDKELVAIARELAGENVRLKSP